MWDGTGTQTVQIDADATNGEGYINLLKGDGTAGITLDADVGGTSRVTTDVLEITGGADLAEPFEISGSRIPEGSVVVIDPKHPGNLMPSREAYDRKVAGIVSGAGGIRTGLMLNQKGSLEGGQNVALSGRVYAMADAGNGPIEPGDMLTTSSITGRCMKASDPERSRGAIIGKAMSSLESGTGLVLVLVNLQ